MKHQSTSLDSQSPRIFGMMRVKNEARWIKDAVESALTLCERVLILDDHSDDGTPDICVALGDRVTVFRSEFKGLNEARDKDFLLARVIQAGPPGWVLCIDGDEVLEPDGAAKILAAIQRHSDAAGFWLRVIYLWDSPQQMRVDGIYGPFSRVSLFRLRGQALARLAFRKTRQGGTANFHCSAFPQGLAGRFVSADVWLKHYGYMLREDRLRKYAWYTAHDPNNGPEDRYRHMVQGDLPEIPADARLKHAGPLRLEALASWLGRSI